MTTCSVLRCQNPGSAVVAGGQELNWTQEAFVCAEHKRQIDAGAAWEIHDHQVLMDQDIAPSLESWSSRDRIGTRGLTLTLEATGQTKPYEVFLTPADMKILGMLFSSRGE